MVFLVLIVSSLNACAFIPRTETTTSYNGTACSTVTSEWYIDVIAFDDPGFHCDDEICAQIILAVPVVTAVVSLSIVAIGSVVNFTEKQFRCN